MEPRRAELQNTHDIRFTGWRVLQPQRWLALFEHHPLQYREGGDDIENT
jgi:hypothetical protein